MAWGWGWGEGWGFPEHTGACDRDPMDDWWRGGGREATRGAGAAVKTMAHGRVTDAVVQP